MNETSTPRADYATEENLSAVLHESRYAGGISASGQRAGFGGNLYTRDGLRVMRDTMTHFPSMTRELLSIFPQMQGIEENETTNEFKNSMPHQTFRQIEGGRQLPDSQLEIAEYWTRKWGVEMNQNSTEGKHFTVYNSSDAPLLYLITLAEFADLPEGKNVLNDKFLHRPTGQVRTVGEAAHRCADFITSFIGLSEEKGPGLYGVPNTNPRQTSPSGVMRDGFDSYYHPDREHCRPIDFSFAAYIDNQALAYEALQAAIKLFPDDEQVPLWRDKAEQLRSRTLEAFWMPDSKLFAAAIDGDGEQVRLKSTAMLELLNSSFLKVPEGPEYVRSLVKWLYSPEVMTAVGPRMLSLEHDMYEGEFYSYQGTGAVWPVVNGIVAKGLRNEWGLPTLSQDLGIRRTLGLLNRAGEAVELCYVDKRTGEPLYQRTYCRDAIGSVAIAACDHGQIDQAWTASAGLRELWDIKNGAATEAPGTWQRALARQAMSRAIDFLPASANHPTAPHHIDIERGEVLKLQRSHRLKLAA